MVTVTYYCPRCGTVTALERDAYLADKSVTPYPLAGWRYVAPTDGFEREDVDGVRFVCGRCERPFYLNFVKFDRGVEVEPRPAP